MSDRWLEQSITYRPAVANDFDFLYTLHRASMYHQVVETWDEWDDAWQRAYFYRKFLPSALQIIQIDGKDIGMFSVQDRAEELFLVYIKILPAYQRQGIGTLVLRNIIDMANTAGKPVVLRVLRANHAGQEFYKKLGFVAAGETKTHRILMREQDSRRDA